MPCKTEKILHKINSTFFGQTKTCLEIRNIQRKSDWNRTRTFLNHSWQKTPYWWWSERIWVIFYIIMIGNNSSAQLPWPSAEFWRIIGQYLAWKWNLSMKCCYYLEAPRCEQKASLHSQIMVRILGKKFWNEQKFILNPWYRVLGEEDKNKWESLFLCTM